MNKFSVIMPVYNAGEFLESAVKDVLHQTYTHLELIAVDDGSTDGSLAVLQKFAAIDGRIKLIKQNHLGGGMARNTGLSKAVGDYVLFLDADDCFENNLLEIVYDALSEMPSDILVFAADSFLFGTNKFKPSQGMLRPQVLSHESRKNRLLNDKDKKKILKFTSTTVWNKVFNRKFLENNKIAFQDNWGTDSLFFTITALFEAKRIGYVTDVLVHYREGNPTGQISKSEENPLSAYKALLAAKEELLVRNLCEDYKESFICFAAENVVNRFENIKSYAAKKKLFDTLHNEGLKNLGLDGDSLDFAGIEEFSEKLSDMSKYSYEEYLHTRQEKMLACGLISKFMYAMPKLDMAAGGRIVLYGAGNVGKSYFTQIMNKGRYKVVLWVDGNYKNSTLPVHSPDCIFSADYDLILLAVEQEKIADEISSFLIKNAVPQEKILWQPTTVI